MDLNVLLIFQEDREELFLRKILIENGYRVSSISTNSDKEILNKIPELKPNLVIIFQEKPQRTILTTLRSIQNFQPNPIIVFADFCDSDLISDAINAGASSFILDGIEEHRISAIIEVATARFNKCQIIKKKLTDAEIKLEDRRNISKAKGILMNNKSISEDEAYSMLRSMAMKKNIRIGKLAKDLIVTSELLQ